MTTVEVINEQGEIVWTSPEVQGVILEEVDETVRVIDMTTGQVVATYRLKLGERAVRPDRIDRQP